MKKLIAFICLSFMAIVTIHAQFLFRISGGELKEPSFMLGTIHNLPGTLLDSIAEYKIAESRCQQMYVEVGPKGFSNLWTNHLSSQKKGKPAIKYPEGKTIFDVIDKESAVILKEKFREVLPIDLGDEKWKDFQKMPPGYFLHLLVSRLPSQIMKKQGGMDMYLMQKAMERGWNIGQLDDEIIRPEDLAEHQDRLPQTIEEQADSLMAFLKSYDESKQKMTKEYETTCHYWRKGNIDGFIGLILPQISNHTKVYKDRNEKWLPKMVAAMREKPTMFVFGSGHLIGEYGIIHLLRDAGYEVEQIKIQ